ncbi:MAG: isoaspartyl peptidase/L-asparaginase [Woeseiaceae bacterium]|nr:isoaspartyl peptidase/L-asparaginase [Woeseiaceae bacterium]
MTEFAIYLHGGAGPRAGRDYSETEQHLAVLAEAAKKQALAGRSALDIVESAVNAMEASGLYVAGRGSAPNSAGYVELDASIMNGATREAGAVACLRDVVYPITVARGVMEQTDHVMLAGIGARQFAEQREFELVSDPASYYRLPVGVEASETVAPTHGTVGAVALDQHGHLAAATSTGGTFGKLEGRVGDTPLIGPGTWADDRIAVSCTGVGEHIIRSGGALAVALAYRGGATLEDAVQSMLDEVARLGGDGGAIAVTANGECCALWNSEGMKRASVGHDRALHSSTFAD